MRICFVTAGYVPDGCGGVELSLHRFARWALRDGHEVLVFRRVHEPERPEFEMRRSRVDGVSVVSLNYRFGDATDFSYLLNNPTIRAHFEAAMQTFAPDVVHVHHLTCLTTEIVDAARECGTPVVVSLHDFWMGCPRGQRLTSDWTCCESVEASRCIPCYRETWAHWFQGERDAAADEAVFRAYRARVAEVLAAADALVVPSPFAREIFVRDGVPRERMEIVEYGLDASSYQRGGARGSGDGFRVGFLGTVLPSKGVHVLIEAFCEAGVPNSRLDIHGPAYPYHGDTSYDATLARLAEPRANDIAFHGAYRPEQAAGILAGLDVLVVPSIWFETYCMVIREAFLAGVPVIASDFGAMRDAIVDGETGLLFPVGDARALAERLRRLAADPRLRRRVVGDRESVRTVEENAQQTMAIYRRLLDAS